MSKALEKCAGTVFQRNLTTELASVSCGHSKLYLKLKPDPELGTPKPKLWTANTTSIVALACVPDKSFRPVLVALNSMFAR